METELGVDDLLYLLSSGQLTPEQMAELPEVDDLMLAEMAENIMLYTAAAHTTPANLIWNASDSIH
jgi:hypothetical protein